MGKSTTHRTGKGSPEVRSTFHPQTRHFQARHTKNTQHILDKFHFRHWTSVRVLKGLSFKHETHPSGSRTQSKEQQQVDHKKWPQVVYVCLNYIHAYVVGNI